MSNGTKLFVAVLSINTLMAVMVLGGMSLLLNLLNEFNVLPVLMGYLVCMAFGTMCVNYMVIPLLEERFPTKNKPDQQGGDIR